MFLSLVQVNNNYFKNLNLTTKKISKTDLMICKQYKNACLDVLCLTIKFKQDKIKLFNIPG